MIMALPSFAAGFAVAPEGGVSFGRGEAKQHTVYTLIMRLKPGHNPVPSWMWRLGADSRYIGGTTAGVAELADAQDLGSCGRKAVGVQIPPSAPAFTSHGNIGSPDLIDLLSN